MLVISNNCCGGRLYQRMQCQFNNPFIWMVAPYDSIIYTMDNWRTIRWNNIKIRRSSLRKNTFIIVVDDCIELHYVHYKYDANAKSIVQEHKFSAEEEWTGDVFYYKIWEFVTKKYVERAKRMLSISEPPMFLIREGGYANAGCKHTLADIANHPSNYRRIIITTDSSLERNDDVCKVIHVDSIEAPSPTVLHHFNDIREFFAL